jgi:hypothetical protein
LSAARRQASHFRQRNCGVGGALHHEMTHAVVAVDNGVAGAVFSTVIVGLLTPPALMRRMYCGSGTHRARRLREISFASTQLPSTRQHRHADRHHRVLDQRRDADAGTSARSCRRTSLHAGKQFLHYPLSIVTLSISPTDTASTCRAHSNVPMSWG